MISTYNTGRAFLKIKFNKAKSKIHKSVKSLITHTTNWMFRKIEAIKRVTIFSFVDSCRLWILIVVFILLVAGCGFTYFELSKHNTGIVPTYDMHNGQAVKVTLADSLYYSFITVSSLGYGDYRPIGYGRLVSAGEVIFGLMLFSLIVAKLASERQSSIIKLIYSSDVERRIKQFIEGLDGYRREVDEWKQVYLEPSEYVSKIQSLENFVGGISNFLRFQVYQGVMLDIKSEMFLRRLFRSLHDFYVNLMLLTKSTSTPERTIKSIERVHLKLVDLATKFKVLSDDTTILNFCENIIKYSNYYDDVRWRDRQLLATEILSSRILLECNPVLSTNNNEKEIATKLGLSNKCVRRCIEHLIQSGKLV